MHYLLRYFAFVALAATLVLTACKQTPTVQTASDGTEFIVHTDLGGKQVEPGEFVYYHAQRRKGEEVESRSRDLGDPQIFQIPAERDPNSPTALLEDVLMSMGVGDSATITLRLDTLPSKPPGFEDVDVMYFDMVVVDVKSEADFQAEQAQMQAEADAEAQVVRDRAPEVIAAAKDMVAKYVAKELDSQVQRTESGLGYLIQEEGTGPMPEAGRPVSVQYVGLLTDGTVFDNSFERGSPIQFPLGVGRVIPGWDEGIALLKEGGSGYLFIPAELGYGEAGSPPVIPGGAELVFYVELIKAN
jgi:FKBP-type peptidyl-prolyl cis-trans isomerase FkpA